MCKLNIFLRLYFLKEMNRILSSRTKKILPGVSSVYNLSFLFFSTQNFSFLFTLSLFMATSHFLHMSLFGFVALFSDILIRTFSILDWVKSSEPYLLISRRRNQEYKGIAG